MMTPESMSLADRNPATRLPNTRRSRGESTTDAPRWRTEYELYDDDRPQKKPNHEIGMDLSMMSVDELNRGSSC
jgi:hypothetical protein